MMRAIVEGEPLALTGAFADSMSYCLGCYACETACPAGVDYSALFEAARDAVEQAHPNRLKQFFLRHIFPSHSRLKALARILRLSQRTGILRYLQRSSWFKTLAPRLHTLLPFAPSISAQFSDESIAPIESPLNARRYRVSFLKGCIMNVAFADINRHSVDVLRANGCEVYTPKAQQCCGSLHAHNGDLATARKLAIHNIRAFDQALPLETTDAIVVNAAGCGALMKEYDHLLKDDPFWREKARLFSQKVKDISEFLAHIERVSPSHPVPAIATYHDACHLAHAQGITQEPRQLLEQIPELTLVPLPESTWCCGSAGIYNILNPETSLQLLARKMRHIQQTGASLVITGNPGCILQIQAGSVLFGPSPLTVKHPISVLHQAYFGQSATPR